MRKFTAFLIFGLIVASLASLLWGATPYWQLPPDIMSDIIWHIRLPRLLGAIGVGASLAIAGISFQGMLQNPLADPYVLGVSAGAALGACLCLMLGGLAFGIFAIPLSTCLGAFLSIYVVYRLAKTTHASTTNLILAGIICNALFSAINLLVLFLADTKLQGMMVWLMGDLGNSNFKTLGICLPLMTIAALRLVQLAPKINLISLGDLFAQSSGIPIARIRTEIFFLASALCGLAVANAGVIGFIGLIVPHTVRRFTKDDFRLLIPLSGLAGALLLVVADLAAKLILPTTDLPIGVITALLGAPFFLWIFLKKYKPTPLKSHVITNKDPLPKGMVENSPSVWISEETAHLTTTNTCLTYPNGPSIGPITLSLSTGQLLLIIGPNGSGKSTLLRLLAGLDTPNSGQITHNSTPIYTLPITTRARALVWSGPVTPTMFNFTVQDVIQMGDYPHQTTTHCTQALTLFDLHHLKDSFISTLSSGEQKRVHLAKSWHQCHPQNTPFWLLDEPDENLDINHRASLLQILTNSLQHTGIAIASHHWEPLLPLATHLAFLSRGQLVAYGKKEEVTIDQLIVSVFG